MNKHLISPNKSIKESLSQLDKLAIDSILFVVDDKLKLIGSLTDGDVRRGLINGVKLDDEISKIIQKNPKYIYKSNKDINKIIELRDRNFNIIPVLDENHKVVDVINFRLLHSLIPADVVIMAGGKGTRLLPLTKNVPKPMLKIGDKPIMEYNLDRLSFYGFKNFWISVNYLKEQIEEYFGNGINKNINIKYIHEKNKLGTIGAVSKIDNFQNQNVLITNSDILTKINYEDFYLDFINKNADISIVCVPYKINIPFGVIESNNDQIINISEKPTYTYYSNAGIYLIKKKYFKYIPKNQFFNATQLIDKLISKNLKVVSYPLNKYWLDIGRKQDFNKAKTDIKLFN